MAIGKAQKQLIDTYFRKREIAAQMDTGNYDYMGMEVRFMIKNKEYLHLDKLTGTAILQVLYDHPEYIKKLMPQLYKVHGKIFLIANLLAKQPQLKPILNRYMRKDAPNVERILGNG